MSESTGFPPLTWIDWNGPHWGDTRQDWEETGGIMTIQEHCSRRLDVGDLVVCIDEGMVSWGKVDHLGPSFQGDPDVCVYLRHWSENGPGPGIAYVKDEDV